MATGADQCQDGCGIVMPLCLIAVDVDDKALADEMVARFPAFGLTVACKTKKGMHFYFTRTAGCTLMDGARQAGEALAIDIKTQTRTGTGGVISVPPSPCKEWLREFGECEALPIPAEFVAYYEAAIRASGGAVVVAPPPAQRATVTVGDRDPADVARAVRLVGMLSAARAEGYAKWIEVGICVYNVAGGDAEAERLLLDAWDEFSSQGSTYAAGVCAAKWATFSDAEAWEFRPLGYGSLVVWAQENDPAGYAADYAAMCEAPVATDAVSTTCSRMRHALRGHFAR